jgi:molybdopterin-binding protein
MELTARNMLTGTVAAVTRGPVTTSVKVDVGGGQHVTATVTTEAVNELGIAEGKKVTAIFKASAVILGVE